MGITRGTTRADIVRATLDSIAYQVHEVIESMARDVGKPIRKLRVDGGASASDYLMQFQSDISRRQVVRPRIAETTAIGAGLLAGLAAGIWRSTRDVAVLAKIDRVFRPMIREKERAQLLKGWSEAVVRVLRRRNCGD